MAKLDLAKKECDIGKMTRILRESIRERKRKDGMIVMFLF